MVGLCCSGGSLERYYSRWFEKHMTTLGGSLDPLTGLHAPWPIERTEGATSTQPTLLQAPHFQNDGPRSSWRPAVLLLYSISFYTCSGPSS